MNLSSELLSMCIQELLPLTGKMLLRPSCNNSWVLTSCFHHDVNFVEYHWPLKILSLHKIQFWNNPLDQGKTCVHSLTWYANTQYCWRFQMCQNIVPGCCIWFLCHHWRLVLEGWHKTVYFIHGYSRKHYNFQLHLAWGGNPMVFQKEHSSS